MGKYLEESPALCGCLSRPQQELGARCISTLRCNCLFGWSLCHHDFSDAPCESHFGDVRDSDGMLPRWTACSDASLPHDCWYEKVLPVLSCFTCHERGGASRRPRRSCRPTYKYVYMSSNHSPRLHFLTDIVSQMLKQLYRIIH